MLSNLTNLSFTQTLIKDKLKVISDIVTISPTHLFLEMFKFILCKIYFYFHNSGNIEVIVYKGCDF